MAEVVRVLVDEKGSVRRAVNAGIGEVALAQPREFLTRVFYALSGDYHYLDVWQHPPGTSYLDALPQAPPFPWAWLSDLEMEFFVAEYARSGFTGGLNWYRAMDLRWAQRRRFEGQKNPVPFFFIGSERDCDLEAWHGSDPLGALRHQYEDVRGVAMLDLDYSEDSEAETDMNVVMNNGGAFIEVQGTAEGHAFRRHELDALLNLAASGIGELCALQTQALEL